MLVKCSTHNRKTNINRLFQRPRTHLIWVSAHRVLHLTLMHLLNKTIRTTTMTNMSNKTAKNQSKLNLWTRWRVSDSTSRLKKSTDWSLLSNLRIALVVTEISYCVKDRIVQWLVSVFVFTHIFMRSSMRLKWSKERSIKSEWTIKLIITHFDQTINLMSFAVC